MLGEGGREGGRGLWFLSGWRSDWPSNSDCTGEKYTHGHNTTLTSHRALLSLLGSASPGAGAGGEAGGVCGEAQLLPVFT